MASLITPALVIRHADYADYDRMVTLFTPEYGRIDAIARGCRRSKSPLVNAVEPFTSGEYQLYLRKDRYSIDHCQITDSFYELRTDYVRLMHGVYWLKLLDAALMPEVAAPQLFMITLRALAHLNYSDIPPELLTMAFEMHFLAQLGFAPCMNVCMQCGKPIDSDARFDARLGGTICLHCPSSAPKVSNGARRIIMKTPRTGYDKVSLLEERPEWPEAARLFRTYIDRRIHQEKFAPKLYGENT